VPESSEVRIVVDQLNKGYGTKTLTNVEVVGGKFLKTGIQGLKEIKFPLHDTQFHSHGKFIHWSFSEEPVVFNHLGMAASYGHPSKHSAIRFTFDNDTKIDFIDIRHFGNFKFATKKELHDKLSSLGWDIMEPIPKDMVARVRKFNRKTVAEAMMDQSLMSGCGNYLKSESCYDAKINPLRTVASLNDDEIMHLCASLQSIVKRAYSVGGATIQSFKDMYGNTGKFFDQFKVYGKKTDPNGNPITKVATKDGRSTFYVEGVQR
jgi:DNA-formamidopyrimidine glycosylase